MLVFVDAIMTGFYVYLEKHVWKPLVHGILSGLLCLFAFVCSIPFTREVRVLIV
jgi:hypothetical protein